MEGASHSRSYSHSRPQPFAAGKKPPRFPSNGGNAAFFTTSYDDVFGGPPTFAALAPRREDYSEIFGAFRSSSRAAASIPVLDLPAISADVDSGASTLDYSDVFGGFDDVDFAVPYDELFRPFDASGDCSSDEAWTPVGTESLSDDSDPFALSEKSPCFSDGNSHQSLDDKQFNVSYHKVNSATSTSVPSMTHVAQLNAVPGYTCVVDETISLKEMEKDRFCSTIGDDIILNGDPSSDKSQKHTDRTMSHGDPSTIGDDKSQKHTDQTMSHVSHDDVDALRSFDSDRRSGRACSASKSNVNSTFLSVPDVNLRTEPTLLPPSLKPPSIPSERKGDFTTLWADPRDSESYGFEATADGSLPFYDMEVDASSSAAASSAAIKDAMERAQVKLKAAKVSMDRKNLSFKIDVKGGERVQTVHDGYASKAEQFSTETFRAPAKNKVKISVEDRHASQNLSNSSTVGHRVGVTEKLPERNNGKKRSSVLDTAFTGEAGEWKEATQYYEFVNNDTAGLAPQWSSNGDGKTATLKQQDSDDEHNYNSADEAYAPEENRRRLKATKAVSRQEYYEKMVKVAQEVHKSTIGGHVETQTRLTVEARGTLKQQNGKLERDETQAQQVEEKKLEESIRNKEDEIRLRNALEKEEIKQKETESCHRDQNDGHRNGAHQSRVQEVVESKGEERRIRKSCQWGSCEEEAQETGPGEENERGVREACEIQMKEKKLAGTPKQTKDSESSEVDDNRSKEDFDVGFGAEVLQKACESQENDKMQDLRQRKAGENRLKEACVNLLGGERLQKERQTHQRKLDCEKSMEALEDIFSEKRLRTSGVQENDTTKALQQIYEYENHAGEAVVELEEGVKYKEAPEKEKIKQRLDEAQKLVVECRKSENSKKQATGEARLEKSAKEGHVGSESLRTGELEETCKIPDHDDDNQKLMHRSRVKADQTDKDRAPYSSPETELSVKDEHLKLPNGFKLKEKDFELDDLTFKLKKPQMKAHVSQVIPAKKDNAEIITSPSGKKSKLEIVESADVLIDEIQMRSTVGPMGASDNDLTRTTHAHETPHVKYSYATSDGVSTSKGHTLNHENEKVGPSFSDRKLVDLKMEGEEKREVPSQCQGVYDKVDKVRFTPPEVTNGSNEQLRKKEAAAASMPERAENIQKRLFELPTRGQCTERKGKIIQQEKKREKERDLEQEQLTKLEEEKEREREREKDKMAVESAIREARERAYEDARGRAEKATLERATDEARQRAMAEARERLEKACQEARERSLTDKATEARLRAERAAVERATVEARQRAFEKTMAERVTLEARGRMQRSVSEKYSSERDVAMTMRQSSMPSISERSEGADGEPAQRCKARLERHQRTVERVANALAEKNMRDLLAQKERAERNRFAETLDAEIKRWSSGKEGNLRALLSTLQYILGADSGWHPIPLTEVITAAAVKKAYRKATLYVHPDKLQQRGATVQQKYICEKVFDLLKDAWNRFNSEEK